MMAQEESHDAFYRDWLEIPSDRLPPNHYALLGIADFESDVSVIEEAAKSRGAYLHQIASGPQRKIVQQLLGEVAIAKRTLTDNDQKAEYDRSLRLAHSSPAESQQTAERRGATTSPGPRRRTARDWKYHLISGAVLFGVVGVIWFVNRNSGGRRAADVNLQGTTPSTDRQVQSGSTDSPKTSSRRAPPTLPTANRDSSDVSSRRSPSPASSQGGRRSGLGSGLGSEFQNKFGSVLTDISEQDDSEASTGRPKEFTPMGGLSVRKLDRKPSKQVKPDELRAGSYESIVNFESFGDVFELAKANGRMQLQADRLVVKPREQNRRFKLPARDLKVAKGEAIKLVSSLSSSFPIESRVAIAIDGVEVGWKPTKAGVDLFIRDREAAAEEKIGSLNGIKGGADTVLWVGRSVEDPNEIRFFLQAGKDKKEKRLSGSLVALNVPPEAPLAIVVSAGRTAGEKQFVIREIAMAKSSKK